MPKVSKCMMYVSPGSEIVLFSIRSFCSSKKALNDGPYRPPYCEKWASSSILYTRATYRLGEDGNFIVVGLVSRELRFMEWEKLPRSKWLETNLLKPSLCKMPQGPCCIRGTVCWTCRVLAGKCPHIKSIILLRNTAGKVIQSNISGQLVQSSVGQDVVGKPDLVRLVNVKHIDFVIPRPRIQSRWIGVNVHIARTIFLKQTYQGWGSRTPVHPYWQRGILGVFSWFKKPEKRVDRIILVLIHVGESSRRQMHITGIWFDPRGGLAKPWLCGRDG